MTINPDDPRPPYQQIAAQLRASIFTRTIAPGERLPSQSELAERYGVARMTVQQALRLLRDEGLTVSRQGSGVFARERTAKPVGLRPHIERAFEAEHVSIDFSGYTAETLHGIIAEPLDKIRTGRLSPQSITIRMLLSDMGSPLPIPVNADRDIEASGPVRQRMAEITARYVGAITDAVHELGDLGLVPRVNVETRLHGCAPLFKVYVLNEAEAFFGYYPVVKHEVQVGGERQSIYDPMGKDAVMFHHVDDGDAESIGSQFVNATRAWFGSLWDTIATPTRR